MGSVFSESLHYAQNFGPFCLFCMPCRCLYVVPVDYAVRLQLQYVFVLICLHSFYSTYARIARKHF